MGSEPKDKGSDPDSRRVSWPNAVDIPSRGACTHSHPLGVR